MSDATTSGFAQNIPTSETASPSDDRNRGGNTESPPSDVRRENIERGGRAAEKRPACSSEAIAPQTTIIDAIDGCIAAFRDNKVSKSRAIALISSKLDFKGGVSADEPEKEAALTQYLTTLDSIEQLQVNAEKRGAHAAAGLSQPTIGHLKQSEPVQPIINEVDRTVTNFIHTIAAASGHGHDESDEEDSGGEDGERGSDGGPAPRMSNKRRRLSERDMPWFAREIEARRNANPSCAKTREILQLYGEDFKTVKKCITLSTTAPAGFPTSEWDNITRGVSVDLDKVFSSLHLVAPVKENVGRVGLTSISLGDTEPRRRIQTSGDWVSAWLEASQATAMLFPHRENELRAYGDHINREFSARVVSAHRKVILFDAAVRNAVGGGQSMLLTEYDKFNHIHAAIMLTDGIQSDVSGGTSGSKTDICRRFNASQCPDGESCRFKHICRTCKKSGHGQVNHISRREKEGKADTRTAA